MGALPVSYLVWQRHGYCFRMTVPKDLHSTIGLKEIRCSLKTYDGRRARPIALRLAKFVHDLFEKLRRKEGKMAGFSSQDIRKLIHDHVREIFKEDEKERIAGEKPWRNLGDLEEHVSCMSTLKTDFMEELALSEYRNISGHVDDLLEEREITLNRTEMSYKLLCREMLKALINLLEIDMRRCVSDYSFEGLPYPELMPFASPAQPNQPEYLEEVRQKGPIVSEIVERLVAEKKATGEWTDKTEADYRAAYNLFVRIMGDQPITRIDRRVMDSYKQTLMKLPPNMKKSHEYRDKSIQEILAMDVEKTMATETINRNLARLNVLFNYAELHGLIERNPAKGLLLRKKRRDDQLRAIFSTEDLKKLFNSETFREDKHTRSYSFWVPILALFTGARIDEICQLHLDDIRKEDGVWVFDINHKEEKKLKNPGSARLVPIHPFLLSDLKIISYVESLKSRGEKRLFPELRQRREGYGQTVSKWFGRYKRSCGVADRDKVFHSFRHTFTHNLKQNDVNEVMISELVGHTVNSITMSRYGKRYEPKKLFEAIKKPNYNVNLSHLTRSRFVVD